MVDSRLLLSVNAALQTLTTHPPDVERNAHHAALQLELEQLGDLLIQGPERLPGVPGDAVHADGHRVERQVSREGAQALERVTWGAASEVEDRVSTAMAVTSVEFTGLAGLVP